MEDSLNKVLSKIENRQLQQFTTNIIIKINKINDYD